MGRFEAAQAASGVQVTPSAPVSGAAAKPLPPNIKIFVRVTPSGAKGGPDQALVFWGKKEVAIDLWHHTVYTVATGLAYKLIDSRD